VNVSLFVGDTYKNSVILNLTNITGETVNFTWIAAPGTYAITIKIDLGGEIEEFNESNNELSINLSVMQRETVNSQRSGSSGGSGMIAFKQMCGNSLCEEKETCENCPVDCGNCPVKIKPEIKFNESGREPVKTLCPIECDDGNKCTTDQCFGETNYKCVHMQIIPCCGDYVCEKEESCFSCRDDCGECELKINCTNAAETGEVVECRVTDVENNSMPNVTVRILAGVDVSIAVTDENGMINFTANVGAAEVTFEKNGYSPVKIDILVTSKDEKKRESDSVTKNKFLLLSGFALILVLLFILFGKKNGRTAPESVRGK